MTLEDKSEKVMQLPPGLLGHVAGGSQASHEESSYAETSVLGRPHVGTLVQPG